MVGQGLGGQGSGRQLKGQGQKSLPFFVALGDGATSWGAPHNINAMSDVSLMLAEYEEYGILKVWAANHIPVAFVGGYNNDEGFHLNIFSIRAQDRDQLPRMKYLFSRRA